jgi:catechol 2,3-dioxygenase-like lactoylglutathione lyase family enzyme
MKRLLPYLAIALLTSIIVFGFSQKVTDEPGIRMQTGIVVSDLEKSYEFYTKVVGLTKVGTFHVEPGLATEVGLSNNKAIDIIDFKLTGEPGNPEYKITKVQGLEAAKPEGNSFVPGDRYISIFVNDLKPYYERLKKYNVPLWNAKHINISDSWGVLIFSDPDGGMIEIQGPALK